MKSPSGSLATLSVTQNAMYARADPPRMTSSAGLLRAFGYMGALVASAANAACFRDGVTATGLHGLVLVLVCVTGPMLFMAVADRSLRRATLGGA